MSTVAPIAHRKPWEEHSVVVALVLAVLVPGLGHLFQGRTLKGLIYLVGILGLFLWGVKLGEGVVVYNQPDRGSRRITLHYAAQLGAGIIAYPAIIQPMRMNKNNQAVGQLDKPLTAQFSGHLVSSDGEKEGGQLEGTVRFTPEQGEFGTDTKGTFSGTLDGKPIELTLGQFTLDRPIGAGFRRRLKCDVVADGDSSGTPRNVISGSIPRPFWDGYGVPPDMDQLQEVTGRLGKLHELALVFTWIAGLLNILAIWDCVQGPAYGFGDEHLIESNDTNPEPEKLPNPVALNNSANPA